MTQVNEIVKIRRKVLTEIARLSFADQLTEKIHSISDSIVSEEGPRYRCCVHKERAVIHQRINLALGQIVTGKVEESAEKTLQGQFPDLPVMQVLPEACDRCPIDKFIVTDACRNCLAHNCMQNCPKKAITILHNRAYIDKNLCVECGICKKSCAYGAIIEVSRPCERACAVKAISAATDRKASINYEKCVACGVCKVACPFGAISDRTNLVPVIQALKSGKKVTAVVAPSFIGQFGVRIEPGQVIAAIKTLGFQAVKEASVGADVVANEELHELIETVPEVRRFMTTSCCPAFTKMIKNNPEGEKYVSSTESPMLATGKMLKDQDRDALVVFIGPCIAKKVEAEAHRYIIDYVLTFEELACMFVGYGLNLATTEAEPFETEATANGDMFACAGGVGKAVEAVGKELYPERSFNIEAVQGLNECNQAFIKLLYGKGEAELLEGMACIGGCVGGPGTLSDWRVTGKLVDKFSKSSKK